MRRLAHPNVLPLHASFVCGSELWMVLPFLGAGSVRAIMRARHPQARRRGGGGAARGAARGAGQGRGAARRARGGPPTRWRRRGLGGAASGRARRRGGRRERAPGPCPSPPPRPPNPRSPPPGPERAGDRHHRARCAQGAGVHAQGAAGGGARLGGGGCQGGAGRGEAGRVTPAARRAGPARPGRARCPRDARGAGDRPRPRAHPSLPAVRGHSPGREGERRGHARRAGPRRPFPPPPLFTLRPARPAQSNTAPAPPTIQTRQAANILMRDDGSVLLADLGAAAFGPRDASAADLSAALRRSTFVGTPCWMAPEVRGRGRGRGAGALGKGGGGTPSPAPGPARW
jgi:hypothetical protein